MPIEMIKLIPGHLPLDRVDIWFQDEARSGQQNTTTRLCAKKGSRPRAIKQQQFEYAYLFGAVCPATGETEALITPYVNKEMMIKHLSLISQKTKAGRHTVVYMDGAGWHTNDIAEEFDNLNIMKWPPYSPELNPVEQVWQWLQQSKWANRCFKHYEDIESGSDAWNYFVKEKLRVTKLCDREWLNVTI
ncbi:MAG: transposase [Alteromonadaceae bacterium]|jgi:transposase